MAKHVPNYLREPEHLKEPRLDKHLARKLEQKPAWQVQFIDFNGPWSWLQVDTKLLLKDILPALKNFETMHWNEIIGRNSHSITIDKIITSAQKRLIYLKHDDTEHLVSLRLSGKKRIWGIKSGNVLKILWWDPEHEICPSKLKNT